MIQVLKIGGNLINNKILLESFLKDFNKLKGNKILIHGGGNLVNKFSKKIGISQKIINGRRVTNKKTLDLITMIYAGLINKNIVANLQSLGCNSLGLSGADLNLIRAIRRPIQKINYGYVGDLQKDSINITILNYFFKQGITPILCPLTHDGNGNLFNTNADTIASFIAMALTKNYEVILHYAFEKKGILYDINNENSFFHKIDEKNFYDLKKKKIITNGMIPKLENAFKALKSGVSQVTIGYPDIFSDFRTSTLICL